MTDDNKLHPTTSEHLSVHLSELQLSLHADHALADEEASRVEQHLSSCDECQTQLAAMNDELSMLSATLSADPVGNVTIPAFKKPASLRGFALANILTGLVIWLAQFLWKTIFGELFMNAASWLTSIYIPDVYDVVSTTTLYYLQEGTAVLEAYLSFIILALSTLAVLWLLFTFRKHRATHSVGLLLLIMGAALHPSPASALDIRQDENVITITADEVIDDTLLAAAELVIVKGNVNGDVVIAGRRLEVDGNVSGNVFAFAESVTVRGQVGGLLLSAGSNIDLNDAQIGGDFWGAGNKITLQGSTEIARNATVTGQSVVMSGTIKRDLHSFAEALEMSGPLNGNLMAVGKQVRLLDGAHIFGNADLRISSEDALHRAASAKIDGELAFLDLSDRLAERSQYLTVAFYIWQLAQLAAAILIGMALLWLWPRLRDITVGSGVEGLKSAGLGLVTLISLPVVVGLFAITLIGLPFAFLGFVGWIACFYLAKVIVGIFVGRTLLTNSERGDSNIFILLAGLALVFVAINLPFIGGIINFILTIVGVGLIVQQLYANLATRG